MVEWKDVSISTYEFFDSSNFTPTVGIIWPNAIQILSYLGFLGLSQSLSDQILSSLP